jgi:hypothetical protein
MTRILLAVAIAFAVAVIAYVCMQPVAAETWCNGIVVSNGSCIGSESNVPPPTIDCRYNDSDPRCRSRR